MSTPIIIISPDTAIVIETDTHSDSLSPLNTPLLLHYHVTSLNADITIRQLPSSGLSFQLWPAATSLFTLFQTPHLIPFIPTSKTRKLRVLELGSGTGLVGIAAAAMLAADVTLTDLEHVMPNLEYNLAANVGVVGKGGGVVVAAEMGWGNVGQMECVGRDFDVVIGSDVVYHDHLYQPLLDTLKYFLTGETVFVMAHLKRWKKETVFFKKARKLFDVDVVYRVCPEDGKRVGVIVYRFVTRKKKGE